MLPYALLQDNPLHRFWFCLGFEYFLVPCITGELIVRHLYWFVVIYCSFCFVCLFDIVMVVPIQAVLIDNEKM
jgi:hypothetical protein